MTFVDEKTADRISDESPAGKGVQPLVPCDNKEDGGLLWANTGKYDREVIESLDQVYSTFRHELVNSVNSLKITLEVLAGQFAVFDNRKKEDFLERALIQVARQTDFIEDLKQYTSPNVEASQVAFLPYWTSFIGNLSEKLAQRQISLHQDYPAKPFFLCADKEALVLVLNHLVNNALEAVSQTDNPTFEVYVTQKEGVVKITMKDNGQGIRGEHLKKVFVPLYTTKAEHSGLGLAVARRIVTKMGGKIALGSRIGHGTQVVLWLRSGDFLGQKEY